MNLANNKFTDRSLDDYFAPSVSIVKAVIPTTHSIPANSPRNVTKGMSQKECHKRNNHFERTLCPAEDSVIPP
ncbi:hypothetical protein OAF71_01875, partial [bacterium]|nr:hypothetical protein [bacterium]